MTPDELANLRAAHEKTEGSDWRVVHGYYSIKYNPVTDNLVEHAIEIPDGKATVARTYGGYDDYVAKIWIGRDELQGLVVMTEADAEFIALAHLQMPKLLNYIAELEQRIDND